MTLSTHPAAAFEMPDAEARIGRRTTDADLAVILQRLEEQDAMLERIFAQAAATNGRVRALELKDAIREDRDQRATAERSHNDIQVGWRLTMLVGALGSLSSVIGYVFLVALHVRLP